MSFIIAKIFQKERVKNVEDISREYDIPVLGVVPDSTTDAINKKAAKLNKKALCICTISDHLYTGEELSAEERQVTFNKMMEIALELA